MAKFNKSLARKTRAMRTAAFFICVMLGIALAFGLFCSAISGGTKAVSKRLSAEHSQTSVNGTNLILTKFVDQINMVAAAVSSYKDFTPKSAKQLESILLKDTSFSNLGVLYMNGKSFTADGKKLSQESIDSISRAFLGNSFVTSLNCKDCEPVHSLNEHPLIACAPIRNGGVISGAVYVNISNELLLKQFPEQTQTADVRTAIVDPSLHNLFEPENTEAADAFNSLSPELQKRYKSAMKAGKLASFSFDYGKMVATLRQTAHEGFFTLTTLSLDMILKEAMRAINVVLTTMLALMIAFAVVLFIVVCHYRLSKARAKNASMELETLMSNIQGGVVRFELDEQLHIKYLNQGLLYITGYSYKDLKSRLKNRFSEFIHPDDREHCLQYIKQQARIGGSIDISCRISTKRGGDTWFLIKGNILHQTSSPPSYLCILSDITTMVNAENELNMTMQRYSVVIEQSDSIIFEYNYLDGSIYLSNKWNDKFDFPANTKDFFAAAVETKFIHEDDIAKAGDIIASVQNGVAFKQADVRLLDNTKHYIWCTIKASAIFDENGKVYKSVGRIVDVNRQYHETEMLKKKAELDSLTGIYNKATTQMLIDNFLEVEGKDGTHALLIIDIDNFKQVNDTLGHLAGDSVIKDIATKVKALLRSGDIFGRIGGDEFVILLKGAGNSNKIKAKASELCAAFVDSISFDQHKVDISCSIGIAFYSKTVQTYEQLVDKADTALYTAKKNGKNQFVVYGE